MVASSTSPEQMRPEKNLSTTNQKKTKDTAVVQVTFKHCSYLDKARLSATVSTDSGNRFGYYKPLVDKLGKHDKCSVTCILLH